MAMIAPGTLCARVVPSIGVEAKDKPQSRLKAIVHNQLGYRPGQKKIATILWNRQGSSLSALPSDFRVWTADRSRTIYTGRLSSAQDDALSGDLISCADFSPLNIAGKYTLEVGGTFGDAFPVADDAYSDALRLSMRSYYGQRCGCKIDLGSGYEHGSCHTHGSYHPSSGRSGEVHNQGGWHDAGDYGRYVVNSSITCGTLLWAWELLPTSLRPLSLDLPESGKGIPDYLAEVQWNLRWMLTMQDPADGGVWHKQTSRSFCAFIMPQEDKLPSEVIGTGSAPSKSTCATAGLAATMAIAARCFASYDAPFASACLKAARAAYAWSSVHPSVVFKNPTGVTTGEYGDASCSDELLWASAELFRTTGESSFETDFLQRFALLPADLGLRSPSWGDVAPLGMWAYVLDTKAKNTATVQRIKERTREVADSLTREFKRNAYGHTLSAQDYGWGSNSAAGNQALLLIVANIIEENPAAIEAAMGNLHYLLGRNCFAISWVTQVGLRPFQHPHHRPSAADSLAAPWPGLLSGGPNAHGGDAVANALPKGAPMRAWIDDERAYSLNEVAINWNAPLVFLLAAANA